MSLTQAIMALGEERKKIQKILEHNSKDPEVNEVFLGRIRKKLKGLEAEIDVLVDKQIVEENEAMEKHEAAQAKKRAAGLAELKKTGPTLVKNAERLHSAFEELEAATKAFQDASQQYTASSSRAGLGTIDRLSSTLGIFIRHSMAKACPTLLPILNIQRPLGLKHKDETLASTITKIVGLNK